MKKELTKLKVYQMAKRFHAKYKDAPISAGFIAGYFGVSLNTVKARIKELVDDGVSVERIKNKYIIK